MNSPQRIQWHDADLIHFNNHARFVGMWNIETYIRLESLHKIYKIETPHFSRALQTRESHQFF